MLYDEIDKLSSDELANVSGRFSRVNYEANKLKFESCEGHQAFLETHPDKVIWDIPWMVENFKDEESDDDDDEESDD
jgi:outer membrane scaffolding protein for murein synthesis (MipA/OmpV family)